MTDVPVLSLRATAFGYAGRTVVRDVDLQVWPGDVVAVLGPNGSGKSTVVKGTLGLAERHAGEVRLFGVDQGAFRDHARVGYVPQRHTLSASVRATVTEVVATGRLALRPWWRPAGPTDRAAVARALSIVGLTDRARADVAALSGGQQRRVLIARALVGAPDVLVMDEPTAGVDARAQHELAGVLARLVDEGVTMLVVTHEMGPITDLVARVVVVDQGRVTFVGPRADFLADPRLLHDHDSGHHDAELSPPPQPLGTDWSPLRGRIGR